MSESRILYGLCDCNNFFASCEQLDHPGLRGRPVVVLSSNDGCIIARSREAKALGIKMGEPLFKVEHFLKYHNVAIRSGNHRRYQEISDQVMSELERFTDRVEVYSIDEAFLNLAIASIPDKTEYARKIRRSVMQRIGIPISIGIAPTKTLAKLAAEYAKKREAYEGVFNILECDRDALLMNTEISGVWGIGRKTAAKLRQWGIKTAYDLTNRNEDWVLEHFTICGLRTLWELRGQPTGSFGDHESTDQGHKSIQISRTFEKPLYSLEELREPIMDYVVRASRKLRDQGSLAGSIDVHIRTSYFIERRYSEYKELILREPTADDLELTFHAYGLLEAIYKPDYAYKKAGVTLGKFSPARRVQLRLFDLESDEAIAEVRGAHAKRMKALEAVDQINRELPRNKILPAALVQPPGAEKKKWKPKKEYLGEEDSVLSS